MLDAEFDTYVSDYERQHADSIRLSGEGPGYFADYKIRVLKRLADAWGLSAPEILDFGSGMGMSLPAFRRYFPDRAVVTADVSSKSLAAARDRHGALEEQLLITGNRIPAENDRFDICFTACVFHHISEDEHHHWLRELRRITRPGGRMVIFEHNPFNPLTRHAVRNCPFDENAVLIGARDMRTRMQAAGWHDPRTSYHVFFPRALAALRRFEPRLQWCPLGGQYACSATA